MTLSRFIPLSLAAAIAVALTGCATTANAPRTGAFNQAPSLAFNVADLNPAIPACTDLNGFVNSKWLAANPVPSDQVTWGSFEILNERSLDVQHALVEQAAAANAPAGTVQAQIGDIWKTGMDEAAIEAAGITPLQPELDKIAALDSTAAIAAYLRASYDQPLFSLGASPDAKDSANVIAYVGQGGLGLPEKGYYFDDAQADVRAAYVAYIERMLALSGVDAAQAREQAKAVMAFETRLANASMSRIEMRNPAVRYNQISATEADELTPNFSWTTFFDGLHVPAKDKFSLAQPGFFIIVNEMLADEPVSTWQAYLRFHAVDRAAPYLSKNFEQANFDFYRKTLRGQQEMQPRWKRVLGAIERNAGDAFGQMYVQVAFPPESKAKMEALVQNLRAALKDRIQNLAWMSDETKQKALEKWAAFTPKIGYPDKWRDWSGLRTSKGDFLGNVRAANTFNYRWEMSKIGQPVDKTEWGMTPQTVNAYYNPSQNEVVFPAAILQPPFFDPNADDAVNYGGIGAVIGHEMTHGYDDQGSRFGPTGKFENWWTDADKTNFESRTAKLVNQFNDYTVNGEHVNGTLTLGENIADLGGLATAYDAMKTATAGKPDPKIDGFTRDQRFFFNWATVWRTKVTPENAKVRLATDPHAPAQFRAIGAPSNLPTFAAAFQCKPASPMVRTGDQQVVIW